MILFILFLKRFWLILVWWFVLLTLTEISCHASRFNWCLILVWSNGIPKLWMHLLLIYLSILLYRWKSRRTAKCAWRSLEHVLMPRKLYGFFCWLFYITLYHKAWLLIYFIAWRYSVCCEFSLYFWPLHILLQFY